MERDTGFGAGDIEGMKEHKVRPLDVELLSTLLEPSNESPTGLVWKRTKGNRIAGTVAGTADREGYYRVRINRKTFPVSMVLQAINDPDYLKSFEEDAELFRDIDVAPGYAISDLGEVMSVKSGRRISTRKVLQGYYVAILRVNGKKKRFFVHRLVLKAFVGCCPDGHEVDHKDRDTSNNRLDNLRYVTKSQNNRNKRNNYMVEHLGIQMTMIEALEDIFGSENVSATAGSEQHKRYTRIRSSIRKKGLSFEGAVLYEIGKRGNPKTN